MKLILIVIVIIVFIVCVFYLFSNNVFDDEDPDMDWHDNYAVLDCPHINQRLVTESSAVNCETVHTVCSDCGKVLNIEVDCR